MIVVCNICSGAVGVVSGDDVDHDVLAYHKRFANPSPYNRTNSFNLVVCEGSRTDPSSHRKISLDTDHESD